MHTIIIRTIKILLPVILIIFLAFQQKSIAAKRIANTSLSADENSYYLLAWPGMLPDHPLYPMKILRDKVIEHLVINRVKKIEYHLLMADKNIFASKLLFDKGNTLLARKTALKGENYFTILVSDYKWASWYHLTISKELDQKIARATKKHQSVFKEIIAKTNGDTKKTFEQTLYFSQINYDELLKIKEPLIKLLP